MLIGMTISIESESSVIVLCPDEECIAAIAGQLQQRGIATTLSGNQLTTAPRKWTDTLSAIVDIENSSYWNSKPT